MFRLDDGTVVYSASDLTAASACEFALLTSLDALLGRAEPVVEPVDALRERAGRLGAVHEAKVLAGMLDRFGPWDPTSGTGVVAIARPDRRARRDRAGLEAVHAHTVEVLRTGADVVAQAGFFDGRFTGWADFLVREAAPAGHGTHAATSRVYAVHDAKLARQAKVTALVQLAAYADQMVSAGIEPADDVHLILGDGSVTDHHLIELLPVYRERRDRLQSLIDDHAAADHPVRWGDDRYRACLRCAACAPQLAARHDVLLVARVRTTQRARLLAAGIRTVDELAASTGDVEGIPPETLDALRAQADLQSRQSRDPSTVLFELFAPEVVGRMPPPDDGDVFFDFEGDPLWAAPADAGAPAGPTQVEWGLEYLFGVVEHAGPAGDGVTAFRPFWAHDRAQERVAFLAFLDHVEELRVRHPGMHVYHYAPYERTALLALARRHDVGQERVDRLLHDGVLVDLYAVVRACLRTGQGSASLKKIEALYRPGSRTGDVVTAGESVVAYAVACEARDAGLVDEWESRLEQIAAYNEADCLSTLGLRDWLLARAAEVGVAPTGGVDVPASAS
ncbi:MAG: TM0106 family RecB-like putative nuclease [Cellulomonadaceae bacterium]|nr:TM0106 family RecB-like putative nuclease [Cellulomonadaceae bacterium]